MPRTKLQVCMAIAILGIIAVMALVYKLPEVTTGCSGGIIALGIIALGMKLLEHTPIPPTP